MRKLVRFSPDRHAREPTGGLRADAQCSEEQRWKTIARTKTRGARLLPLRAKWPLRRPRPRKTASRRYLVAFPPPPRPTVSISRPRPRRSLRLQPYPRRARPCLSPPCRTRAVGASSGRSSHSLSWQCSAVWEPSASCSRIGRALPRPPCASTWTIWPPATQARPLRWSILACPMSSGAS